MGDLPDRRSAKRSADGRLAARGRIAVFEKMGTGSNFGQLQLQEKMRSGGAEIRACTRFFRRTEFHHGLLALLEVLEPRVDYVFDAARSPIEAGIHMCPESLQLTPFDHDCRDDSQSGDTRAQYQLHGFVRHQPHDTNLRRAIPPL